MKKIFLFIIALGTVFFISCSDGEKVADGAFSFEDFEKTEDLTADSVVINEILDPSQVQHFINDDYAVLISNKSNKIMYRYRLPEWTFVDTTFSHGEGPDEFLRVSTVVANPQDENIRFFDIYKRKLCFAHVGEKIEIVSTLSSKDYESGFFISAGKLINDRFIVSNVNYQKIKRDGLKIYDLQDSLKIIDSLVTISVSKEKKMSNGMSFDVLYNTSIMAMYQDRMMLIYPYLDMCELYKIISDGHFELIKRYGEEKTYEQVQKIDWESFTEQKKLNMSVVGATKDYIFVRKGKYVKKEPTDDDKFSSKCVGMSVLVYTWDMKPVKEFRLNKNIAVEMLLDTKRNKIYTWPINLDFEKIYTYDYSL